MFGVMQDEVINPMEDFLALQQETFHTDLLCNFPALVRSWHGILSAVFV